MIRGFQEALLVELAPEDGVLAEVHGLVAQFHRLDAFAHVGAVQASRVEERVTAGDLATPPVGETVQLREVVLRRQEGQSDREVVSASQEVLNRLGHVLARGVGPGLEEDVATVDVGAHVSEAFSGDLFAQLAHDDFVLATDVDAAQQRHILHAFLPVCSGASRRRLVIRVRSRLASG